MKRFVTIFTLAVVLLNCVPTAKAGSSDFAAKVEELMASIKARAIQSNSPKVKEAAELLTQEDIIRQLLGTTEKNSKLFGLGPKAKAKKAVKQAIKSDGWGMARVLWMSVDEREEVYVVKTTLLIIIMPSLWEFHVDKKTFEIVKEVEVESFGN